MLVLPPTPRAGTYRRHEAYGSRIPHHNARHTLTLPPRGTTVSGFKPWAVQPRRTRTPRPLRRGRGRGVPATGGRRGRRDNGLIASQYDPIGDVDPRVGEHLLDVLAGDGIAAYLQPS